MTETCPTCGCKLRGLPKDIIQMIYTSTMSTKELSEATGKSRQFIYKITSGSYKPEWTKHLERPKKLVNTGKPKS